MKTKLKIWATSALMLLATQSAFANNLYVGGQVGISVPQVRFGSDLLVPLTGEHHHVFGGGTSFLGGVILGLDRTWCDLFSTPLYTALEFNARYNSYDKDIARFTDAVGIANFRANIRSNFQYGLDFKFGIPVDCCGTTPYLLVGVEAAQIRTKLHNDTATPFRGIPAFGSASFHKTRAGCNVGGGVRFRVWECIDMDMQYSYTWYGRHQNTLSTPAIGEIVPAATWRHRTRLEENRFLVSLSYTLWDLSTWF
jgi:opacity protein-like surface antigen